MNDFKEIDTDIYKQHREKYLPEKIKYLFVAESPPAFKNEKPLAYFYFDIVPNADSLFYTIIKAVYNLDFDKYLYKRIDLLNKFKNDRYYLIDSVEYPINRTRDWIEVSNYDREKLISENKEIFENHILRLMELGHIDNHTQIILIKKTVFNVYHKSSKLNVINNEYIPFPKYVKDRDVINGIRKLINKNSI